MYYISHTKSNILDMAYSKVEDLREFVSNNFYVGDNHLNSIPLHTIRFGFNHITLAIL